MPQDKVTKALGRKFTLTLSNNSTERKIFALFPAHFDTAAVVNGALAYNSPDEIKKAGYDCSHVITDGVVAPDVTCVAGNSKMNVRNLLNYAKHYDLDVIDMSIRANHEDVFNEDLEVIETSPLTGSAPQYLKLDDFRGLEQTTQQKAVIRDIGMHISPATLVLLPLNPGRSVSITMYF